MDIVSHYRYPGVKPFTTEEQDLFFGREMDIDNLFNLIFVKQVVVLYGKSGHGKSSLVNAGIIPKVQAETRFVCFPIRFNNYSKKEQANSVSPTTTVRNRLIAAFQSETTISSPLDGLIHQENSLWYWFKTFQWQNQQSTQFILFFDQFEELFTYPPDQINEFSEQLALLLYPSVPLHFRQRMVELAGADLLQDSTLYQKLDIKVVFSVRSDRLSALNSLTDRHPAILQNCYQLNDLNREQAEEAITIPATKKTGNYVSPVFTYTTDALDAILDKVTNSMDGIELATLQILCRYVEEKLVAKHPNVVISRESLGDITDIFQKYYEDVLNRFSKTDRTKVQKLIEDELIDNGLRNPLSGNYILNKFAISASLLAQLEETSLLRRERDANGRLLYEVSHDTLINAIEKVATSRREVEKEADQKEADQQEANERAKAKYEKRLKFITWIAVLMAMGAGWLGISSLNGAQKIKALYWSSQSDKLPPDQGLRLLEEVAKSNQDSSIYDDYIVSIFNKGDQERFISKTLDRQGYINAVAFSPDGKWIATASEDDTAKVWSINGRLLAALPHKAAVQSVAFSPDSKFIVTSSSDSTIKVWKISSRSVAALMPHNLVRSAIFSPDGKWILTVAKDNTAKIWDVLGNYRPVLHQNAVRFAAFSPDSSRLAIIYWNRTIKLLGKNFQDEKPIPLSHKGSFRFIAFSPNGNQMVTASDDKTAQVWETKTFKLVTTLTHQDSVYSATFSPDGSQLVTISRDKTAKLWNAESTTVKLLKTLTHQSIVRSAVFSFDGKRIVTASEDNTAKIWNSAGQLMSTLTHQDIVYSAVFSNDGNQIMTLSKYQTAKMATIWDIKVKLLDTLKHHSGIVYFAAFSPDGKWIVTTSADKTAKIWDKQGQLLTVLRHDSTVRFADFSPNGRQLVTASEDKVAKVWDIKTISRNTTQSKPLIILHHQGPVRSATFSLNGKWIITASEDKTARIWDLKGHLKASLKHQDVVYSALFSPDSKRIVTASRDNMARIWNIDMTQSKFKLLGIRALNHHSAVRFATFSPNGMQIVTASEDNMARIWDTRGRFQDSMKHQGIVYSVTFSHNGSRIITASKDNTAKIWDIKNTPPKLLATLHHQSTVRFATFAPGDSQIVTVSDDSTARIWYTAEAALKWLKANSDKVPPLSEDNRKKYEMGN